MREMTKTKESAVTTVTTGTSVMVETVATVAAAQKRSEEYSKEDGGNGDNKIRPYHDSLRPNLGWTQMLGSAAGGSDSSKIGGVDISG